MLNAGYLKQTEVKQCNDILIKTSVNPHMFGNVVSKENIHFENAILS